MRVLEPVDIFVQLGNGKTKLGGTMMGRGSLFWFYSSVH